MAGDSAPRMVYVLLDGVGDLPAPGLSGRTPLEAASTPSLDGLAAAGAMGSVVSVGRGIAPESDAAVFSMLGYRFDGGGYPGRGVVEAMGAGADFRDGDLALRANFATLDASGAISDRRAGRRVDRADAAEIAAEVERGVSFSEPGASARVLPTVGHRATVVLRARRDLSHEVGNTDPAYARVGGMGVAREAGGGQRPEACAPLDGSPEAAAAARMVNEFAEQSARIMAGSAVNARRASRGEPALSCLLLRDAGSRRPSVRPISEVYSMPFSCVADMPVELGISAALGMRAFEAGGLSDYEAKAEAAASAGPGAVYVHLKGPDEFGHDGDAEGKAASVEDIDRRFFGPLLSRIDAGRTAVVVSADHSTPCVLRGHSDDPVPLLVSGAGAEPDGTRRLTEADAAAGRLGSLEGPDVLARALREIGS